MGDAPVTLRVVDSLEAIDAAQWNALCGDSPFLRHEFLNALHQTGCAAPRAGWSPRYATLWNDGRLSAAMPLYLKMHSWGEYVFDWAWADAYQRHGLAYYPKLVCTVPFTPVTGPRALAPTRALRRALASAALDLARATSSLHVLFPTESEANELAESGMMLRRSLQFHWANRGYASFEDFLGELSHDKRKKIRQERRRVAGAGVSCRRLLGAQITPDRWAFFFRCYQSTYRAHRSTPYLNLAFFERIGAELPDHLMMVLAERDGRPVAAALNLFTGHALYGRYWGALEPVPALHFEACYYQAIEFAIERRISVIEGGAQGEHKVSRGFLPVQTWSAHWLKHPRFADAVERALQSEAGSIAGRLDELNERSPFRAQQRKGDR